MKFIAVLALALCAITAPAQSTVSSSTLTVSLSPAGKSWRMIYSGNTVIALFESTGITRTINSLYVSSPVGTAAGQVTDAAAKQQCVDYAAANNLTIPANILNPPTAGAKH